MANTISTTNRLTGMYSGLDTDSLVKNLMKIEQLKVDKQMRSLTTMQWKQESYNGVAGDLKTFMNDFISVLGSNTMMKSGNYVTYNATVTGDGASAVTVSGSSSAYAGTVRINSISQLATAAKAESAGKVSKGTELSDTNSATLGSLDFANRLEFVNGEISFAINDEEFTFKSSDSLQTVINTVNASGAGVNMIYSRLTDTISFESKTEGADGAVEIRNISGNAFGPNGAFGIDNGAYNDGKNALLTINGVDVERSSNSFSIDGINYTLNETFNVEKDSTVSPITIKLEQNSDEAVEHVKKFVEGYNTLINKLTELTTTRKTSSQRNYTALTEEEKSAMTEEQIEQWESIAKTGLLYNDAGISRMLSGLRGALYDTIEGLGLSAADIGLRTGTYDTNGKVSKGQISLDEDALRSALEKNPHQVMSVFMNLSESTDEATAYKENGLLHRINNLMTQYIRGSGQTSLDTLESNIYKTTKTISNLEDKMLDLERKYYAKYSALETAMSQMSSQSNWLASMLGTSS